MHALAACFFLFLGACQAPRASTGPEPLSSCGPTSPAWLRAPLSWDKLDAIELWLAQSTSAQDRGLALEAHLQLAEGRIEFTRRDSERGKVPDAATRARVETARRELEQIQRDPYATPGQRTRAGLSLDGSARLLSRAPASVARAEPTGVLPRSTWRAKPARKDIMTPLRGNWSRITVHHSAETADASPGASLADSVATLQRIQKVHMDPGDPAHGWADIGYHFLIDAQGRVFEGRGLGWQGAHARGANNFQNLGVCLLGDYSRRSPSPAELAALDALLEDLRTRYRIPASKVYAHRELSATECPGPALQTWVERYRQSGGPQP